jgi:hypothetical protein
MTDYMTPVVLEAAERYGVKMDWFCWTVDGSNKPPPLPADFSWGPQGHAGFSLSQRYVYACNAEPSDVFHEFVHAILGKPGLLLCEGYLLMPFEWCLAKHLARRMKNDARWFLRSVREYQEITEISWKIDRENFFERFFPLEPRDRRSKWWRRGIQRAQRLGLLDDRLRPTYQLPKWIGSGVASSRNHWGVEDDHRYA